ncbi:MAG: transposase, partial [Synergistaceae bacterium]|nr:transposase [Synergistaceae bacterium]
RRKNQNCNNQTRPDRRHIYLHNNRFPRRERTGKSVGYDFGLKKFLTASDRKDIESPLFFVKNSKLIKKKNKNLSRKKEKSNNRRKARIELARAYKKTAKQRKDFHFKTALKYVKNMQ